MFAGWVTELAKWQRSESLSMSLIAAKALANMDVDRHRVRQPYGDSVFVYHPMFCGDGYDSSVFHTSVNIHSAFCWDKPGDVNKDLTDKH